MQDYENKVSTHMRWQPLVVFVPIGVVINAAVFYLSWLIWVQLLLTAKSRSRRTFTDKATPALQLSLSRLDHLLPRSQAHPEVMQRTAEFHHQIADAVLPQSKPIFDNTTALDTTVDMLNPKTALVQ